MTKRLTRNCWRGSAGANPARAAPRICNGSRGDDAHSAALGAATVAPASLIVAPREIAEVGPVAETAPAKLAAPPFPSVAFTAAPYAATAPVVDGDLADWPLTGPRAEARTLADNTRLASGPDMFFQWRAEGQYFAYRLADAGGIQQSSGKPDHGDCFELFIDTVNSRAKHSRDSNSAHQYYFMPFGFAGDATRTFERPGSKAAMPAGQTLAALNASRAGSFSTAKEESGGYTVEGFLSIEAMRQRLAPGTYFSMDLSVSPDFDFPIRSNGRPRNHSATGSGALREFQAGGLALQEALSNASSVALKPLRANLNHIATIGVIAPMFGLIGTVVGMILTFATLAETGSMDKTKLAAGLAFALYKTAGGLIVAIPAIIAGRWFSGRIASYAAETDASIQTMQLRPRPRPRGRGKRLEPGHRPRPHDSRRFRGPPVMKPLLDEEDHEAMDDRTDLVALIDCVFLVLLFYVVAAAFTEEGAFPVVLPKTAGTEEVTKVAPAGETITVFVSTAGEYSIGKGRVPPGGLSAALRAKVAAVVELALSLPIQGFSIAVERPDSAAPPEVAP